MADLSIESVALRHFRNIARADLGELPRVTVLSGDNGQGKTSVLEAVYLVCTTRSFRTSTISDLVSHSESIASVRAVVANGDERREQSVGLEGSQRKVTLAGKRPRSFASYAVESPVVVFHPGEMVLSSGPASKRRTLLDRVALFIDPTSTDHLQRYTAASRSRQRTLETRGTAAAELVAFEELMALHGAALMQARREASELIVHELGETFRRMTADARPIEARYEAGGPLAPGDLASALAKSRERDRHRGSASAGPHRDDLVLEIGGYDVRVEASQGEHRAVTLALKMAELSCITRARGTRPVLLLDDVSSELDLFRTALLFEFLSESPGQILLTTTRPMLIDTRGLAVGQRRDFHLRGGVIFDGPSGGSG
ncbi:MAG TPA: DNA replication and repair protein RecF [Polyangiaceae bacterium]|nr:DNA replication and repair protein RecF [Polyangiaceae bacterium]